MTIYDVVVIGGGFFGCEIANHLAYTFKSVVVLEKSGQLMRRASYINQARVHNGYHYPKSLLTAIRSRVNFSRFCVDYRPAIVRNFAQYYAISRQLSSVSSHQYLKFCETIKADAVVAEPEVSALFSDNLIEDVFKVGEFAFNSLSLRDIVIQKLKTNQITVEFDCSVQQLSKGKSAIKVKTNKGNFWARTVINVTYSGINRLHVQSDLPILPLKNELTEMLLVKTPSRISKYGLTVMCGPFFSLMPFPARKLHTLSHVRYTPHFAWLEKEGFVPDYDEILRTYANRTAKDFVINDASRYVPAIRHCEYVESLWEIKTILPSSEKSDSRPILFHASSELPGYFCLMGGKIDNIYDIWEELDNHEAFKEKI